MAMGTKGCHRFNGTGENREGRVDKGRLAQKETQQNRKEVKNTTIREG